MVTVGVRNWADSRMRLGLRLRSLLEFARARVRLRVMVRVRTKLMVLVNLLSLEIEHPEILNSIVVCNDGEQLALGRCIKWAPWACEVL